MKTPILLATAILIGVVGYGYVTALDTSPGGTDVTDTALVENGQRLYNAHCADCHGANLEGAPNWRTRNADGTLPPPPHDATGHTWHHPDAVIFKIVKHGGQSVAPADFKSAMPAYANDLSDHDIWAVLSYIKSTWPAHIQDRHTEMTAQQR